MDSFFHISSFQSSPSQNPFVFFSYPSQPSSSSHCFSHDKPIVLHAKPSFSPSPFTSVPPSFPSPSSWSQPHHDSRSFPTEPISLAPGDYIELADVHGNTVNINVTCDSNNGNNSNNPYFSGKIWLRVCKRDEMELVRREEDQQEKRSESLSGSPANDRNKAVDVQKTNKKVSSHQNKPVSLPTVRGVSHTLPSLSPDSTTYPSISSPSSSIPDPSHGLSLDTVMLILSNFSINDKCKAVDYLVKEISNRVSTVPSFSSPSPNLICSDTQPHNFNSESTKGRQ